jgi:hypothetical protein
VAYPCARRPGREAPATPYSAAENSRARAARRSSSSARLRK